MNRAFGSSICIISHRTIGLLRASSGAVRTLLGQDVGLRGFRDSGHGLTLAALIAFIVSPRVPNDRAGSNMKDPPDRS